ncbi:lytic transglycosylase domain-containing protein [uncultured Jannaschia sp.]|uniref:lytic transglycosylase domain-containing protein n=1 Tax=uncultured Jannaschia sp. TaxID=293347 RepID=UPI00260AC967|nr:lytic transglycosylase domain-containing protein [uncultured Jannaschia sp.]
MMRSVPLALAAALACAVPEAPALADFTFKRVRPPAAGTTKFINIQIEPPAPEAAPRPSQPELPEDMVARTAPSEPASRNREQAWFWSAVSPEIGDVPGRFRTAARVAARPPQGSGVAAPALAHLRDIAKHHGSDILRHSVGTRVSPALVLALISVESAGRTDAMSHKGASGLMQLIPATAERFGVSDTRDPEQNIRGGVAYLDWLMREFGGDPVLALAGYNAGEGAVRRHEGVPPYGETRAYVPKVMAAWNVARTMCTTPPELPGDGCVFDATLMGG